MKSTRTRAKNDVIGSRRSEPIILSDFLPQFYQGRPRLSIAINHSPGKRRGRKSPHLRTSSTYVNEPATRRDSKGASSNSYPIPTSWADLVSEKQEDLRCDVGVKRELFFHRSIISYDYIRFDHRVPVLDLRIGFRSNWVPLPPVVKLGGESLDP
ncbi:hypothetical protein AVEN_254882-1 [Araneus ventricosus]|uniref:Uncharacterized protein n=1 Tax=Araneus ventricosus TaxID=182803 RepID=A0A4Y2P449_ARAVE|nr:hypothetical protein AVEN_222875-1 [Araneus ventricosus]GBN46685.1 hypothetical protein AVEN_229791-1 [Araneus ventricosus]GBN47386.1 hypothetical protein AVEN_127589-1 [Araneus ventricosus]GBN47808.1 hypothetical protein AVEN_254882-1 [Araneus ventricosus]